MPGLHSALGKREASVLGALRLMEWGATLHKGHGQNPSLPTCIGHALHLPEPFIFVRDGNTHSGSWAMNWLTYRYTELRSQDIPGVFPLLSTPPLLPTPSNLISIPHTLPTMLSYLPPFLLLYWTLLALKLCLSFPALFSSYLSRAVVLNR